MSWQGIYTLEPFVIVGSPAKSHQGKIVSTCFGDNIWLRSHTVIYAGNYIGNNFQTGHNVLIREDNQVGNDVSIGSGSILEHHIKIGNRVRLHSNVFIPEFSVLEDDCWLGPHVVLTNAKYPRSPSVKQNLIGPLIQSHAKIGANVTILPGVKIGYYALVGAGSVVTQDVSPGTVVVGNPARVVNTISNLPYHQDTLLTQVINVE